jgi:SAM-dependent methyltransferase
VTAIAPPAVRCSSPDCGGVLREDGIELSCEGCGNIYPVVAGVPDLRVDYPDPYLSREEDLERARELAARLDELDLPALLRLHWRRSGKPPELAERFLARDMQSIGTSAAYLAQIERRRGGRLGPEERFLEVGCGTAGLAIVAARRAGSVVACDASMRWLVLARKRLAEAGVENVQLVCCTAERPPFAPAAFDVVGASDMIEHVPDPDAFVAGCSGLLAPGGTLFMATPNRFSLGLEPHVRLPGVGWLPRRLAERYVRAARDTSYAHVRLLSSRGLRRLLEARALEAHVEAPEIPEATQEIYSGVERRLVGLYNRIRARRGIRGALLAVGPFFHVFGTKVGT